MNEVDKPMRIFAPLHVRWATSGYLIGCCDLNERICCIVAIVHVDNIQMEQCVDILSTSRHPGRLSVIGYLDNLSVKDQISHGKTGFDEQDVWLTMKNSDSEVTDLKFLGIWKSLERGSLLIYYDPLRITKSVFLCESVSKLVLTSDDTSEYSLNLMGNIDFVLYSFRIYKDLRLKLSCQCDHRITPSPRTIPRIPPFISGICQKILQSGLNALSLCDRLPGGGKAWKVFNKPAVLCQLKYRWTVLEESAHNAKRTPCDKIRFENAISQQVFDLLLGIMVMLYFLQSDFPTVFAEKIMSSADWVASELQVLLKWMMGFPAGLKLNSQLDSFLGRFFLYHIYLWTGYLQVLRPVLSTLLWYICSSGCLGVTTQLCLVQDLISMMTLHIYCFYVYAARLYDIQMRGLASLWRLFRGKKWNVLRKRVDSTSFDVDQLFLGTLLFTILLFLLPTTALYYIVFTALRLLVLVVQGTFNKIVSVINVLPLQSLIYRVVSPETVSDGVFFTIYSPCQARVPLSINLQLVPASLVKLWQHSSCIRQHQTYSWKNLGSKLYWGKLIYPWIESKS